MELCQPAHPFHDWNAAVEDFEIWRTGIRADNYHDCLALIKDRIPNAKAMMRSGGGNAIVAGLDPESRNAHLRDYQSHANSPVVIRRSSVVPGQ